MTQLNVTSRFSETWKARLHVWRPLVLLCISVESGYFLKRGSKFWERLLEQGDDNGHFMYGLVQGEVYQVWFVLMDLLLRLLWS